MGNHRSLLTMVIETQYQRLTGIVGENGGMGGGEEAETLIGTDCC